MKAVEIFAGAGGMALGVAQAGFSHAAVVERDDDACETIRANRKTKGHATQDWPLFHKDVREFDYSMIHGEMDLFCAGLPCQPFSLGGKGRAHRDKRDMFSEVIRGIRELSPKAVLIENVKGLLRPALKDYFEYLLLALASPTLARTSDQSWRQHFEDLQRRNFKQDLRYNVQVHCVNAADYGAPQWRERVLLVAFRSDLATQWSIPKATHSLDSLLWQQWKSYEYWERHGIKRIRPGKMSPRIASRLEAVSSLEDFRGGRGWRTVRDAIKDLDCGRRSSRSSKLSNHHFNFGARPYAGHCGSVLDEPAKTLKAGDHGVPGGENTLALGGERVRYFTVRECARLQTFPDSYHFAGAWTSGMRQVGNAVPVELAKAFAKTIRNTLERV